MNILDELAQTINLPDSRQYVGGAGQAVNPLGGGILPPSSPESPATIGSIFGPGGIMEKMADAQNPLLKDSGLPPWAKALMTLKIGVSSGGKSFGINASGMGDAVNRATLSDMLGRLSRGDTSGPSILRNPTTETTPASRVTPRQYSPSNFDINELLTRGMRL